MYRSIRLFLSALIAVTLTSVTGILAAEPSRESLDFFENQVRPLLLEHCVSCHGPRKAESGLRLDTLGTALKGGDRGAAVVPGEPAKSLLLKAVRHENDLEMPPDDKLEDSQIAVLERWLKDGAAWPEGMTLGGKGPALRGGAITPQEREFWSYQPVTDPQTPVVDPGLRVHNPIDQFVQARLVQEHLAMRAPADKRTLLRRATFDLTGLPTTPEEMEAFLKDESPQAFATVVDRLLQSPAYGERWGRHWLDVIRYADTAGETADYPTPLAYKYRNWVINALNADMPYDQFLREQIAGDLLAREELEKAGPNPTEKDLARYHEQLVATGFIAISRRFGFDVENYHNLTIQDTIDTTGQAVLGLSLGCARCHDHKFDPVNMTDYYGWYGIFESTRYSFPGSEEKKRPYDSFPALPPTLVAEKQARFDQRQAEFTEEINRINAEIKPLEKEAESVFGNSGYTGFENETLGQGPTKPFNSLASVKIVESAQSPFQNVFPQGSRGLTFPSNNENNAFGRTLESAYTPANTGVVYYNIDFRNLNIADGGGGAYRFYLGHGPGNSGAMELAANATSFLVKRGDKYEPIRELKMGVWYNVQVALDLNKKTYSGTITAFNEDPTKFEDIAFTVGWDGIVDYTFVDRYGPGSGATPAHDVDNLSVSTKPFLPSDKSIENATEKGAAVRTLAEKLGALGTLRQRLGEVTAQRDAHKKAGPFTPEDLVYGAIDQDKAVDAKIQIRGEKTKLGDVAPRRNLEILGHDPLANPAGSGRRQLADWLTRPTNPLTARVMVNRIWQQHFGRGLVGTENDFGARGELPTHPELLDWLASRFLESGWSMKALHRLIMLSAAYQQASTDDPHAAEVDPEARLLWRFNRSRLSAEEIRDAMLFVSGDLDPAMGGEHPFPPVETWGFSQHAPYYGVYPTNKRSVYLMQQRLKRHPFLALFDGADPNVSTARRSLTTVPTQALYLMNNDFVHARALSFAKHILKSATDDAGRLSFAYLTAFGRQPEADEIGDDLSFLKAYLEALPGEVPPQIREEMAWAALARTFLTRNEFLFVD